jgi:hypothetical protein
LGRETTRSDGKRPELIGAFPQVINADGLITTAARPDCQVRSRARVLHSARSLAIQPVGLPAPHTPF